MVFFLVYFFVGTRPLVVVFTALGLAVSFGSLGRRSCLNDHKLIGFASLGTPAWFFFSLEVRRVGGNTTTQILGWSGGSPLGGGFCWLEIWNWLGVWV